MIFFSGFYCGTPWSSRPNIMIKKKIERINSWLVEIDLRPGGFGVAFSYKVT